MPSSSFSCSYSSSSWSCASDQQPAPQTDPDEEQEQELIPSLPYDVALHCLARVPRCHLPTLSLVSKAIKSLLSSPLFFHTRSILHATQPFLFLYLSRQNSTPHWLALSPDPNPLAPSPPFSLPPTPHHAFCLSYALLGSDIYVIGGLGDHKIPSSEVWFLDCRFNRWRQGPAMRIARGKAAVTALDGKIYVMGGCQPGSSTWAEVLDPVVGSWEQVVSPFDGGTDTWVVQCEAMGGRIYAVVRGCGAVAYDPKSRVWESFEENLLFGRRRKACLEDWVFCFGDSSDRIMVVDVGEVRKGSPWEWKEVKGLDQRVWPSPRLWPNEATMVGAGGKSFLVWTSLVNGRDGSGKQYEIWCSQVEVHKNHQGGEFWGALSWSHKILSSSEGIYIRDCFFVGLRG